ncbi:hypothetical protein [Polymorphobacter arshaanensis]|uniref:hypothetical protein n=1 Tax=Glacieibacterium arshaanense TaxID=2511025 RepID=UPI00140C145B|nr:hypothetical protein [Polymorphobacter arshaanensis]
MIKKFALAAVLAATTLGFAGTAIAGEGHWSIGGGVQCRLISGVVVCSKSRP